MKTEDILDQFSPKIKKESLELRMKIAKAARYYPHAPNHPYTVKWDAQTFYSHDTSDLVDQVIAWLKKPVQERAEDYVNRHE